MSSLKVSHRKVRIGVVLTAAMKKTIVVRIERLSHHPLYRKVRRVFSKMKVHDEKSVAKVGDKVRIVETRPLSKEKRWRLEEVLKSP